MKRTPKSTSYDPELLPERATWRVTLERSPTFQFAGGAAIEQRAVTISGICNENAALDIAAILSKRGDR